MSKACKHEWTYNVHMRSCDYCLLEQTNIAYGMGNPKWVTTKGPAKPLNNIKALLR